MNQAENKWSRAGEWYAAGLFLVYAVVILLHPGAPSLTDYANWTYQGVLLRDHLLGRPDAAHVLKHYPVPNSAATLGIGLLMLVLPWLTAAKVYLCAQLLVSYFALRHLIKTIAGGAVAWVVVPQAVLLNVNFWYGFANFELGLCWVMLMASLLLRRVRGEFGSDWILGALLLVTFFTHMIPFCFCGLLVLLYAVQTQRWPALWQAVPGAVVSGWYVLGRFLVAGNADGQAGMTATVKDYSAMFWVFKGGSYLKSFGFVNPMGFDDAVFGEWGLWILFFVNVVLAAIAGWAILRSSRASFRMKSETRFLWWSVLLLVPVFLLAPGTALGVSDPGARLLQTDLALALVIGWEHVRQWRDWVASGAAGLLSLAGLWLFVLYGGASGALLHHPETIRSGLKHFANVPSDDQDYFYGALNRGEMGLPVFPTGMFLNR